MLDRTDEIARLIEPGRVHRRVYTDPDIFELEMDRIFGCAWLFVGHASQVREPGDYITGMMDSNTPTYLLTVADLSQLVVKMKISEMDVLKLHEGMSVDVKVDALPGETYPARVSLVAPQAEKDNNGIKSFRVDVALGKNDPRLKPGMTARVDGLLESRKNVLKIPLSAVFEEGGKEIAYAGAASGKLP